MLSKKLLLYTSTTIEHKHIYIKIKHNRTNSAAIINQTNQIRMIGMTLK